MQSIKAPPADGTFVPAQPAAMSQTPAARPVLPPAIPTGQVYHVLPTTSRSCTHCSWVLAGACARIASIPASILNRSVSIAHAGGSSGSAAASCKSRCLVRTGKASDGHAVCPTAASTCLGGMCADSACLADLGDLLLLQDLQT